MFQFQIKKEIKTIILNYQVKIKQKYVLHYENFQPYLNRVLEFNQLQLLKTYVEFNTQKRTKKEKIWATMEKLCTN